MDGQDGRETNPSREIKKQRVVWSKLDAKIRSKGCIEVVLQSLRKKYIIFSISELEFLDSSRTLKQKKLLRLFLHEIPFVKFNDYDITYS